MNTVYLSLGSNQGDRLNNLRKACLSLSENIGFTTNISSVYQTNSWGFSSDFFFNICLEIKTQLSLTELFEMTQIIEKKIGKKKRLNTSKYQDRPIDIDILFYNDTVLISKELSVPHLRLQERQFVLVPLAEIASEYIHPTLKVSMSNLLKTSSDSSSVVRIPQKLNLPKKLSERFNYIAIEGNIGAGKTSLTNMLSEDFNAKKVLERFADNAFLPKFYNDKERFAFPLEMSFLADRYQQLTDDLAQFDLFKSFIISDYYIFKSLIFAQVTLADDEYGLYRKIFDIMYKEITKPDLYIYLYQNTDRLLENIKKRGRDYEQNIEASYLQQIHNGYSNFIKTEKHLNTLVIDVSELDFVNNYKDYLHLINKIESY